GEGADAGPTRRSDLHAERHADRRGQVRRHSTANRFGVANLCRRPDHDHLGAVADCALPGSRPQAGGCGLEALSPKSAGPTRTCVAPNITAVSKSPLIPIDSFASPLRAAILAKSAKCGPAGSSAGGMHIRPSGSKP